MLRQKKVTKEKATPGLPVLRTSLCSSAKRAAAELALRAQTVLADFPRLACGARRRSRGPKSSQRLLHSQGFNPPQPFSLREKGWDEGGLAVAFEAHVRPPRNADRKGEVREHCLSPRRGRVAQRPFRSSTAGKPEGPAHRGRLFLGYFLLARQKKVTSCRATPGRISSLREKSKLDIHPFRQAQGRLRQPLCERQAFTPYAE